MIEQVSVNMVQNFLLARYENSYTEIEIGRHLSNFNIIQKYIIERKRKIK